MNKFLYSTFKDFPLVGNAVKIGYLTSNVKNLVEKTKQAEAKENLKGLAGDELEDALNDEANGLFDENIGPYLSEMNLPSAATDPIKEKAIEELVAILRDKVEGAKKEEKKSEGGDAEAKS